MTVYLWHLGQKIQKKSSCGEGIIPCFAHVITCKNFALKTVYCFSMAIFSDFIESPRKRVVCYFGYFYFHQFKNLDYFTMSNTYCHA